MEWIQADESARLHDAFEILSRVQLPISVIREEISKAGMDDAGALLQDLPSNKPSALLCHSNQRTPTHILIAGGHDASWRTFKTVELYNPHTDAWIGAPSMPSSFSLAGAATVCRNVFVVGASMYDTNVCQYDKRTSRWSICAPLKTSRVHAAVAGVGSVVYVCGGRTGFMGSLASTEIYHFNDQTWLEGPWMCEARCSFGAASLNGDLYAIGGQSARAIYDTVEVLHHGCDKWIPLGASHLNTQRKYLSVSSVCGRLFAVGGMNEHRVRLSSVEALDPREGKWRSIKNMSVARSSCGVASLNDRLYVLGGNAGDDTIHDTVECYVAEADDWLPRASMICARSGLSSAAI